MPIESRKEMICDQEVLSIRKQCEILSINRSSLFYNHVIHDELNVMANRIQEIWIQCPCYGYRRITAQLNREGFNVNHKRVQRLMQMMNIKALYPKRKHKTNNEVGQKFPYLLADLQISKPNQVWATDITYIYLNNSFVYLTAIIDWYSRYIVSWQLSNTMETEFCLSALNRALIKLPKPEILNSDQGSQFTSNEWIKMLENNQIKISHDGKGRWADNIMIERFWRSIKHEHLFINSYSSMRELRECISEFVIFYNERRLHQSLDYKTPMEVYHGLE